MDTDYLPLGGHLLPDEFQAFLIEWNMAIAAYSSEEGEDAWLGESRKEYQRDHPELWEAYKAEFKRLNTLYPDEVKALKLYQKNCEKVQAAAAGQAAEAAEAEKSVLYQDAQDAYADEVGCGCCWCMKCKDEGNSHCLCGYTSKDE